MLSILQRVHSYRLVFLFLMIILHGCVTDRQLLKTYRESYVYNGFGTKLEVNGTYPNLDTAARLSLIRDLWAGYRSNEYRLLTRTLDSATVGLRYDGDRRLYVTVQSADTVIEAFTLKVKRKANYLSVKRRLFLIPIPFFYMHYEDKQILITDSSGKLISVQGYENGGWVVMIVGGSNGRHASAYRQR